MTFVSPKCSSLSEPVEVCVPMGVRVWLIVFVSLPADRFLTAKLKCRELRSKKKEELQKQLEDLKTELMSLRVAKVTGGTASKLAKIRTVRKSIARIYIVMNTMQKENLRKFYSKKKFKPLDLRPKLTRAKRRELTKSEKSLKTRKERRKLSLYPQRKFALKL
ncbi:unnamed protein product [Notodromas monacha]|uniref:Large ribosomal subunit protein uL29 n=1 Tax=Notodromas monacha TaxID=399045 RepID=A0A7R9BN76_9CRUS|nr:unnamed protein product [Notodromas monacha]CAG0917784.1 unnamed protein product [Notodromas monacha]